MESFTQTTGRAPLTGEQSPGAAAKPLWRRKGERERMSRDNKMIFPARGPLGLWLWSWHSQLASYTDTFSSRRTDELPYYHIIDSMLLSSFVLIY